MPISSATHRNLMVTMVRAKKINTAEHKMPQVRNKKILQNQVGNTILVLQFVIWR